MLGEKEINALGQVVPCNVEQAGEHRSGYDDKRNIFLKRKKYIIIKTSIIML